MAGSRKKQSQKQLNCRRNVKKRKPARKRVKRMKITSMNHDCLERVFDFLDLDDFLNVAETNKPLQLAAQSAFKHILAGKELKLDVANYNQTSLDPYRTWIGGLKSCLQFVRCFGDQLTELRLFGWNDHLDQYIQQYCADTLTKIDFSNRKFSVNSFQKAFPNVEVMKVSNVNLKYGLKRFVAWFPNVRHLKIAHHDDAIGKDYLPVTMPRLEHLTFYSNNSVNYEHFLRANPQLQSIELLRKMAIKRSLDIIKGGRSIVKLKIFYYGNVAMGIKINDVKRLAREHPLLVEVIMPKHEFNVDTAMMAIQHLKALKIFRFVVANQLEYENIVKRLDSGWHHEAQQTEWRFRDRPYLNVKLSR